MLGRDTGSVKAVDGVAFKLQRGEVLGLVGESGSGKTTLSRAVLSLVKVTGGSIVFNGETIRGFPNGTSGRCASGSSSSSRTRMPRSTRR